MTKLKPNLDPKWSSGNELNYLSQVLSNDKGNRPFTDRLEEDFAKKYNVKYAIAMNSATSAIHAALVAAGVEKGDEIITTPYTVLVDSGVPMIMGAVPVYADIDYETHNIDPKSVESRITEKTKVIIPVSYHGLPYDIDAIIDIANRFNLIVIEDNAQTQLATYKGRMVGQDAHMSLWSFERTKHISTGEGGMLVSNDETLAVEARKFAGMGFSNLTAGKSKMIAITPKDFQRPDYVRHDRLGLNYRYNEFCAAVALAQFERLDEIVDLRQKVGKLYDKAFKGTCFEPQSTPEDRTHSYFSYGVKSPFNEIEGWLDFYKRHQDNGGDDFYGMMQPAYKEPIMVELGYAEKYKDLCPTAEKVQQRSMLFKTNYRNIEEAEKNINVLRKTLSEYSCGSENCICKKYA
jgi:perosamine synthetase